MRSHRVIQVLFLLVLASSPSAAQAKLLGSKHDLSTQGSGKTLEHREQICVFCHTPHIAEPTRPVWNDSQPAPLYTPYWSPTLQAQVGQPTGTSKICLSCHDGTIANASVPSPTGELFGPYNLSERADLSSDLSDDHPVSFTYDTNLAGRDPELVSPDALPEEIWLDENDEMQCTSCHDPHSSVYPNFLVMESAYSQLCIACHRKSGWTMSAHATSSAEWDGSGTDPWPYSEANSVAAAGCASCHTSHAAGIPESLLVFPFEEENCLACHDGGVATTDIASDMQKPFSHPVEQSVGVHVAVETPESMPRHVECHDCHDPHAASEGTANAPEIAPPMAGVPGVASSGAAITSARFEYEVCFRCHADGSDVPTPFIERQILQPNIRLKFDVRNPSFHPVEQVGKNTEVPSLIFPMDPSSIIYCSDCHSSDAGVTEAGARGPHGSVWPFLLEQEYSVADGTVEGFQAYAMCYKCHDRDVVLSNRSFPAHRTHVVDYSAPCSTCHDPHGISGTQGNPINNSHLINFDVSIVESLPDGRLEFVDGGMNSGECFLACHGGVHDGAAEFRY